MRSAKIFFRPDAGPALVCRAAVRRVGRRQGFDHLRSAETFPHPAVGGAGGGGGEDTVAGGEDTGVTLPPAVVVYIGSCLDLDRVPEPFSFDNNTVFVEDPT